MSSYKSNNEKNVCTDAEGKTAVDNGRHFGHMILEGLKQCPESISQIDAATGEEETNASVLSRSIRLAQSFRKIGLQPGDVMLLSGENHLDLRIPYYAALYNGLPTAGIFPHYQYQEIKTIMRVAQPKIAFCEPNRYDDYVRAAKDLGLDIRIVTFGRGDKSMHSFMHVHYDSEPAEQFRAATFDLEKYSPFLVSTSGTTESKGGWKLATFRYKDAFRSIVGLVQMHQKAGSRKTKKYLHLSSIQWISSYNNFICQALLHDVSVQTSGKLTMEHFTEIMKKYKPNILFASPPLINKILYHGQDTDLSSLTDVIITGAKVFEEMITEFKTKVSKTCLVLLIYGQTETLGLVLVPNPFGPPTTCGKEIPTVQYKLVDPTDQSEITKRNVTGELWIKGQCMTEYYRNPEMTAEVLTPDGWYKTGDLFYKDDDDHYFYVDRLKELFKYKNHTVAPSEIEEVIKNSGGVEEVAVITIPHPSDGEHAIACIAMTPNSNITENDIINYVKNKLPEEKHLHAGVIFLPKIPLLATGKVARTQLRQLVLDRKKQ